jgi:hypothetical protein
VLHDDEDIFRNMINYLNDIIVQDIKPNTNHAIQWQMVVMVQAQSHILINTKIIMFKDFP